MNRAEAIKKLVLQQKEAGQFHEQVHIENNSTGHSYKTLFGRFLDEDVQYVVVEDPYIRNFHQVCIYFLLFYSGNTQCFCKVVGMSVVTHHIASYSKFNVGLMNISKSLQFQQ